MEKDGGGGGAIGVHAGGDGGRMENEDGGVGGVPSRIHYSIRVQDGGGAFRVHAGGDGGSGNGNGSSASGKVSDIDRFTSLPEGVLGKILSLLIVDEGARTAVLCKRMRHVWRSCLLTVDDSMFDMASSQEVLRRSISGAIRGHNGMVERLAFRRLPLVTFFGLMGKFVISYACSTIKELVLIFPGERLSATRVLEL